MNRSVVTHHSTAWWRSHRATSRCTAGSVVRRRSGRGGKRAAWATLPRVTAPLPQLQPEEKAVGQHDSHGLPMKPRPQAALVLIPAQLPFGLFMKLLDRMPPMGIPGQLFEGGVWRQVAPAIFLFLGLPPGGSLPPQPAAVALPGTAHPPALQRHKLFAQPPFGAPPPANRPPLPAGHGLEQFIGPPHRGGGRAPHAHREVCPHPHHIPLLPC